MPISLTGDESSVLVLEGVIAPEDVDQLQELIRDNPGVMADLSACEHMHTAALQLLMVLKVPVLPLAETSFWRHFFNIEEVAPHEDSSAG